MVCKATGGAGAPPQSRCVLLFYYYGGLIVFIGWPVPLALRLQEGTPSMGFKANGLLWMLMLPRSSMPCEHVQI